VAVCEKIVAQLSSGRQSLIQLAVKPKKYRTYWHVNWVRPLYENFAMIFS